MVALGLFDQISEESMPIDNAPQLERLLSLVKEGQLTQEEFGVLQAHFDLKITPPPQGTTNQTTAAPESPSTEEKTADSFWKKPIFGNKSLVEKVTNYFAKPPVPPYSLDRYGQLWKQLETKAITLQGLENRKFGNQEFLDFFRIRILIDLNMGTFKNLKNTIDLFEVMLFSLESFVLINETEFLYRSPTQLKVYEAIADILDNHTDTTEIVLEMKAKVTPFLKEFKTDEGLRVTKNYILAIKEVSRYKSGVKLLNILRNLKSRYSLLLSTFKLAQEVLTQPIGTDLEVLEQRVSEIEETVYTLCSAMGMPRNQNNLLGHVKVFHFLALNYRNKNAGAEFKALLGDLRKWEQIAGELQSIKDTYPPNDYDVPDVFKQDFPGLPLYQKYQRFLNIRKA
ncbi:MULTISPECIES: hypothetical protein [unclassified Picosynechococcus]|uniref:hypothetical protein n=2 Tax=Cyanobacteriota TaxID=1117 RepID=UPI000307EC28|nr:MULTISPECIES: hypothetical protein [unclassified Picosynechococcus]SMH56741.1 hypothetical protein SAMN06272755_3083 [Picosynechococcus sp. OG1]SMQ83486.1 hypothetical protein SAMN06272774_2359 [Synechococcus sp. 7002]